MELESNTKILGGAQRRYKHYSDALSCYMHFTCFLPKEYIDLEAQGKGNASEGTIPTIIYLSGLTCTDENAPLKSMAQRKASDLGVAIVFPSTSPPNMNIEGEDAQIDVGTGAGFYVDAVEPRWAKHYKMRTYVVGDLIDTLKGNLPFLETSRLGLMGHSMGGHGALVIGLSSRVQGSDFFASISAFAPICNPSNASCTVGNNAFTAYFGGNSKLWHENDALEIMRKEGRSLVSTGRNVDVLVDQGKEDSFYKQSLLLTDEVVSAKKEVGYENLNVRFHDGYDHGYFFVCSFIDEHIQFHFDHLRA